MRIIFLTPHLNICRYLLQYLMRTQVLTTEKDVMYVLSSQLYKAFFGDEGMDGTNYYPSISRDYQAQVKEVNYPGYHQAHVPNVTSGAYLALFSLRKTLI